MMEKMGRTTAAQEGGQGLYKKLEGDHEDTHSDRMVAKARWKE